MIRLSGQGRAFRHGGQKDGLYLEENWSSFDNLTPKQRDILRDFHGRHIRVHPHDYDKLSALGLHMQTDDDGHPDMTKPLVELADQAVKVDTAADKAAADAKKTDTPKTFENTKPAKTDKADAKKEG